MQPNYTSTVLPDVFASYPCIVSACGGRQLTSTPTVSDTRQHPRLDRFSRQARLLHSNRSSQSRERRRSNNLADGFATVRKRVVRVLESIRCGENDLRKLFREGVILCRLYGTCQCSTLERERPGGF